MLEKYKAWDDDREKAEERFRFGFHTKLDNAFEQLERTTSHVLGCTDEELNAIALQSHATQVLSSVRLSQASFHDLRSSAEQGLREISRYSQEVFAKEYGFDKLKSDVECMATSLESELSEAIRTRQTYSEEFQDAQTELDRLVAILRDYDDKVRIRQYSSASSVPMTNMMQDPISKLFCANAWNQYGGRKADQELLRNRNGWRLRGQEDYVELTETVNKQLVIHRDTINNTFAGTIETENMIIDRKKVADEVYNKVYDMEVCLISREIELSVEDAVRHILKLVYLSLAMVDQDEHVKKFKGRILAAISDKYGRERTEELKKARKLLEFSL